jgi:hypothetical protein
MRINPYHAGMEHTLIAQLKELAGLYAAAHGTTIHIVAKRALNDNTFFTRIDDGNTTTLRRCEKFYRWLSDNWPSDKEWPAQIVRPSQTEAA